MDASIALKKLRAFRRKVEAAEKKERETFDADVAKYGLMKMPRRPHYIKIDGVTVWPAARDSAGLKRAEMYLKALLDCERESGSRKREKEDA